MPERLNYGIGLQIAETLDFLSACRDTAANDLEKGNADDYNRASAAADEYAAKLLALLKSA